MISPSDNRVIFFAFCLVMAANCDPTTYMAAPNCTDTSVDEYLKRFTPLKAKLEKPTVLGYVGDSEKARIEHQKGESIQQVDLPSFRRFFMAQYSLVPNIILKKSDEPLLLGNFKDEAAGLELAKDQNLTVEENCRNGVFLFARKTKK